MHFVAFLLQNQPDPEMVKRMVPAFLAGCLVFAIVCLAVVILPFWFICKKAGFSPWLSLLNIVPFGTLILLYVVAFAEWKVVPVPEQAWYPPQMPPPPQA
jgi:hypothetical protein